MRTDAFALVRGEERELDAVLGEELERFSVGRGFSEPHALRRSAVVIFVVGDAPANLGDAIAAVGEGQDHVVIDLRHGGTVSVIGLAAAALAIEDHAIGAGGVFAEPAQEGGADIEADAGVVVDDADDLVFGVDDAGSTVGGITLRADAFVPVVIGGGRVLRFYGFKPRVLARRLVEVTVNADETFAGGHEVIRYRLISTRRTRPYWLL